MLSPKARPSASVRFDMGTFRFWECGAISLCYPAIGVVPVSLLLTLNIFHHTLSSVSVVNFEQVNADWVGGSAQEQ